MLRPADTTTFAGVTAFVQLNPVGADIAGPRLLFHVAGALHRPEPRAKLERDAIPGMIFGPGVLDQRLLDRQNSLHLAHVLSYRRIVQHFLFCPVEVPLPSGAQVLPHVLHVGGGSVSHRERLALDQIPEARLLHRDVGAAAGRIAAFATSSSGSS